MPALLCSPIGRIAAHRVDRGSGVVPDVSACPSLLACLSAVPDPRHRRGMRHRLATVLAVAVCAVLAGARSFTAIGEWVADAPPDVLAALGVRADPWRVLRPPDEATVRRVMTDIDADALDMAIGGWLGQLAPPAPAPVVEPPTPRQAWPAVAVDGKTLRGSGPPGGQVHLLAVMDHHSRAVLGQVQVNGKSNEITAFQPLLDRIDVTRTVVTSDAMHTQREHVDYLVTVKRAAYVCIVKTQPAAPVQATQGAAVAAGTRRRSHPRTRPRP